MNKIKVAVIGGGNMGKNHVRNYFLLPDVELVGLADINPATQTLAEEYRAKFYTDYIKMLDELQSDAVSIVVPTPLHAQVAGEVMKRGIHCLVEKPIASTVAQADELIKLAKDNNVIFTVGHIEHYNPMVRMLKQMIDNNKLGKITSIVAKRVGGFPAVEPKTDVIIDLAVHDIGIINYLLGKKPSKISSHGSRTHHSKEIDSAEILMDYGYASGFVQANWLTPVKIRTIAITGSEGYADANYITQQIEHYKHNMTKIKDGFSNFVVRMGEPEKETIIVNFEEPLAIELKAFTSRIRGEDSTLVSPEDARNALDLALQSLAPHRNNKEKP